VTFKEIERSIACGDYDICGTTAECYFVPKFKDDLKGVFFF